MIETIKEGQAIIKVKKSLKISKEMDVFYNPIMKTNRDLSILILKALDRKKMNIGLPLEGTGIRGIRFLKELERGQIQSIAFNDYSEKAVLSIKKNLILNRIIPKSSKKDKKKKIRIHCEDANLFLLNSRGFDYIDIDPFGTSNPFLDSAIKRIARHGILAVTNTDTASLAGTYPEVCKRLYWATPKHGLAMHEIGLRILIRKIQLVGMQHDKALIPVFCYFKDHYFRMFFESVKSKDLCDWIIKNHGMFENAGPLWLGQLWDVPLVEKMVSMISSKDRNPMTNTTSKNNNQENKQKKMRAINNQKELERFLLTIKEESIIPSIGFFDTHQLAKSRIIRKDELIEKIKRQGYHASSTHFLGTAIRTNAPKETIERLSKT